jgi:mannan endo-1,6-alpha-mannosidase
MIEACEFSKVKCNVDQYSFKAYLSRWLALSAQLAPFTATQLAPILQHNAQAAARICNAANQCGSRWDLDTFDGAAGVGQQMSALSIVTATLFKTAKKQVTADTGGTSKGNPGAGTGDPTVLVKEDPLETKDRAGAWIITILVVGFVVGGSAWLVLGA